MKINDVTFRGPYSAADAPEVLFQRIKNCAEIAILGNNPYTEKHLITNAIRLLLTTGLYTRAFKEWDRLLATAQTWIELCRLIQEAFQRHLNATALTAGGHGYTLAFHQNAFGILENNNSDDDESLASTVATQVTALTYQSQLTQSTTATIGHRQELQLAQLAAAQEAQHATMHQIIEGLNAVAFNASDAGRGMPTFGGRGGNRGRNGPGRGPQCGGGPPFGGSSYNGGYNPPNMTRATGIPPFSIPGRFQGDTAGGVPPYHPQPPGGLRGGYGATGRFSGGHQGGFPGGYPHAPTMQAQVPQPPYSNTVKRYANWNVCYSCGFNVADGHTSMSCPPHLRKATHQIGFNRQNAQQYIDLGHPCSTRNRHKTQFPATM